MAVVATTMARHRLSSQQLSQQQLQARQPHQQVQVPTAVQRCL
jgi:hypothetical protein